MRSNSDYATDKQTQKSISGYRVLLEGAPVMFKTSTQHLAHFSFVRQSRQKLVALSVCEAEQTAGVLCAQNKLYLWNVLKTMGLKVVPLMLHKMDNKGTVNLANNWSIGGCTRHIDVWQCLLLELKESKVMGIFLIKGTESSACQESSWICIQKMH